MLPESPITITFSESMAADSVVAGAIALSPPVRGSVSSSGATATFTPGSRLEYGTTYTATVKTSARDAAGNALQSPYSWTFRTIPPPPAPVAVTERESDANVSEMVALDATASLNPSGLPLIFTWTQTSGPDVAGPSGSLFGARPRFIAPAAVGTVEFDLVVDDGVHTSAPAHVQIDVLEDKSKAVFVHPEGNDANAGTTRAAPMKTIQAAIDKAAATGADVYVAAGVYQESLTLADGVSIYGAFDGSWVRNRGSVTKVASPTARALQGDAVRNLVIDGLTIVSAPASAPGESSYGILLANSGPVTISNDDVTAGDGAMGADGREGTEGAGGANGGDGENGCIDGTSCGRGRGGSGGIGFWVGGAGGRGGAAVDGSAGVSGLGPGAGRGGSGGAAANPGRAGSMGMNGSAGATGGDGALGAGVGPAVATGYVPVEGQKGWTGAPGSGGGGGGGGGGQSCAFFCLQGTGNGGGGGGGGGLGGSGGRGGQGGGGSFGIFLFASPAVAVAGSNAFHLGAGGAGGSGGPGGSGGRGGMGGHGATAGLGEIGAGGGGGNGGRGGDGGNGGRGASGPAMNVFR